MRRPIFFIIALLVLSSIAVARDITTIRLKDVDGKLFVMKDHVDGDANLVLFWATWCLPCQKEFPEIQKLIDKYPDKKINVFAISKDTPRSMAKVKSFIRQHDYSFTWLMDTDGAVSSNFMVDAIPQSFLADASGTIVHTHTGYRKGDELDLEKELLKLWEK